MNNLLTQKFPIAAFALLFVLTMSCSHEPAVNESNNPNGSNVHEWEDSTIAGDATMTRMVFSVGDSINVVRQGQTRATTTIAGVTTFQINDIVTIGVAGKSAKDYKVTNTTSGALAYNGTATDAYCWQSTSETVSLRAWSYGNTTTNSGDPDDAVYTLPTDQSSNYGELLYAPATNYDYATYNSSIPITLYHQLARLVINLEHIKTGDLNVSEIYIGDGTDAVIPTTAKFHKPTSGNIGTWDNIGTEKGKITPKTETANACYSAVLIPGTYAANQKFMVIKTSDSRTYCYIPTSPIVLAAGNQYNYTISVKDLKEVSTLTIGNISAYTYDGTAKEPHPTVTDGSKTLTEGTDYTLSWSNNTNAGTATVTVTGMGGYYNGSQSKNFTINPKALTGSELYFASATKNVDYSWNVASATNALTKPAGCTVTYSSGNTSVANVGSSTGTLTAGSSAGAATITATATGNYSGTATYTLNVTANCLEFSYVASAQTFTTPKTGNYKIECWGASGGSAVLSSSEGTAGYVSGVIMLTKNQVLYVYTGQQGKKYDNYSSTYMFNGGGYANKLSSGLCGSCGGGATDIRTTNGSWDNSTSLNSRIMVAAGGGGVRDYDIHAINGCAGGLQGYDGNPPIETYKPNQGKGGTQTAGGAAPTRYHDSVQNGTAGELGKGGIGGRSNGTSTELGGGSGGGGGLYGGSGASGLMNGVWFGGGGSSYISGHSGCTAKTLTFSSTVMIDGAGYQWTSTKGSRVGIPTSANGSVRQNGYVGNGFCRITYCGD